MAAWLATLRGDHDRATLEIERLGHGQTVPPDMTWGAAVMLIARSAAGIGHVDAIPTLTRLLRPHSGLFSWYGSWTVGPFDLALAELALASGDLKTARHHLDAAQTQVDRIGAVVYQPDLDAVRARLTGTASPDPG